MGKCVLCGIQTSGSVGAAGIKWSNICQPCKDIEDTALLNRLRGIPAVFDTEKFDEVDALKLVENKGVLCLIGDDFMDYQENHE